MSQNRMIARTGVVALLVGLSLISARASGQQLDRSVNFRVSKETRRLSMIVNTSRILTMDHTVPKILVMNPDVVQAQPLAQNKVHVSARKTGVTQINVWNSNGEIYSVDVLVTPDARELSAILKEQFPHANLNVRPIASSVIISGYVPSVDLVPRVISVAEDYYPNVINNIDVGGAQQILLHTKVMEVSRTKLRALGFDWAALLNDDAIIQTVSGLLVGATGATGGSAPSATGSAQSTLRFGIVSGDKGFFGFLEALRSNNLAKVLAEPTLVTISGRPASFNSGGEFPIIVPQSLGTVSVEYRQFGTRVDYVPIVLGNGMVRLEVRPQVSEIDTARSVTINSVTVPGLRTRYVDTAVEMRVGQTLALAGLIQTRVESERRGFPYLADLPFFGVPFRRVEEQINEVELLILVTPQFVAPVEPHQVPAGPGQLTRSPTREELFFDGYLEVPKCSCGGHGSCQACRQGHGGTVIESIPPAGSTPQIQPNQSGPQQNQQTFLRRGNENIRGGAMSRPGPAAKAYYGAMQQAGARRSYVHPAAATSRASDNPYSRKGNSGRRSRPVRPGLIGPVGYDDIK